MLTWTKARVEAAAAGFDPADENRDLLKGFALCWTLLHRRPDFSFHSQCLVRVSANGP